ncbi:MAG: VapE domain-containing protein [Fluviibacter sp.]
MTEQSMRRGATIEEWHTWARVAGRDLLPCVMSTSAQPARDSRVSPGTWSKTPTRYNAMGRVTGIAKWTDYEATAAELDSWSKQSTYGICLITRDYRAIDIDVTDRDIVDEIVALVVDTIDAVAPIRTRANSTKCAILVRCPGDLSKTIVRTAVGAVEFLATGQQIVVAGTHSSGARLQWTNPPSEAPTISVERWHACIDAINRAFGIETLRTKRALANVAGRTLADALDPAVPFILASPYYEAMHGGAILLRCPFEDRHTTPRKDPTETVYFPAGVGGIGHGGFRCMHAHCQGISASGFLTAIGYYASEIEDVTGGDASSTARATIEGADGNRADSPTHPATGRLTGESIGATRNATSDAQRPAPPNAATSEDLRQGARATAPPERQQSTKETEMIANTTGAPMISESDNIAQPTGNPHLGPLLAPAFSRDRQGSIELTETNIVRAVAAGEWSGVRVRYDAFTDRVERYRTENGVPGWYPLREYDAVVLLQRLESEGIRRTSADRVYTTIVRVARAKLAVDTAQQWARSCAWDGVARIDSFLAKHFGTDDTPYTRAVSGYLWIAIAARIMQPGAPVHMLPVAVGAQGIGKTSGLRAMMPDPHWSFDVDLGHRDNDIVMLAQGKCLAIMTELRGMGSRDAGAIKSFISRDIDVYRRPYARDISERPRRFVLVGDTNDDEFLSDPTGNRRFLPFRVERQVDRAGIIELREQCLAEAVARFADEGIQLSADYAEGLALDEVEQYETLRDSWIDTIRNWLAAPMSAGESFEVAPRAIGKPRRAADLLLRDVAMGALGLRDRDISMGTSKRLGAAMRACGMAPRQVRTNGVRVSIWRSVKQMAGGAC